jgi:hypothetical protein
MSADIYTLADKFGQRYQSPDEEGVSFEKSALLGFVDALQTERLGNWQLTADYWHRECLAARDAISAIEGECEDAKNLSDGRLNTTRVLELLAHIPSATDSEHDPNNYCDPTALGAISAWRDVLAERRRQVSAEGWTPGHDDEEHQDGTLALAAAAYAAHDAAQHFYSAGGSADVFLREAVDALWPWAGRPKLKDSRRNLVRAGALILAEIERIDRLDEWVSRTPAEPSFGLDHAADYGPGHTTE